MAKTAATRRAANSIEGNDAFRFLVRVGYVANGILHILIGLLAMQVAFGDAATADQNGALGALASAPGGVVMLWAVVIGTAALALFQLLELVLVRGTERAAMGERAKYAAKALAYLAIGGLALGVVQRGAAGSGETQSFSSSVLSLPGGVALLLALAVLVGAVGIYLVVKGARRRFLTDLKLPGGTLRTLTTALGAVGYVAKGVAIVIVGVFVGAAALTADASKAEGLDGALTAITRLPFGTPLLVAVAAGFVLFGLYCFVRARYARF